MLIFFSKLHKSGHLAVVRFLGHSKSTTSLALHYVFCGDRIIELSPVYYIIYEPHVPVSK